jgi:hypothetical protein
MMIKDNVKYMIIVSRGIDNFAPLKNSSLINNETVIMKLKTSISETKLVDRDYGYTFI